MKFARGKQTNIDDKKDNIQNLGLGAIEDYFKVDIKEIDDKTLTELHKKAKLGMSFEREMGITKRNVEMNYLRVFKLVAEDKKELKSLIKKSLPKYSKI